MPGRRSQRWNTGTSQASAALKLAAGFRELPSALRRPAPVRWKLLKLTALLRQFRQCVGDCRQALDQSKCPQCSGDDAEAYKI
jgi:hypothetical protein